MRQVVLCYHEGSGRSYSRQEGAAVDRKKIRNGCCSHNSCCSSNTEKQLALPYSKWISQDVPSTIAPLAVLIMIWNMAQSLLCIFHHCLIVLHSSLWVLFMFMLATFLLMAFVVCAGHWLGKEIESHSVIWGLMCKQWGVFEWIKIIVVMLEIHGIFVYYFFAQLLESKYTREIQKYVICIDIHHVYYSCSNCIQWLWSYIDWLFDTNVCLLKILIDFWIG